MISYILHAVTVNYFLILLYTVCKDDNFQSPPRGLEFQCNHSFIDWVQSSIYNLRKILFMYFPIGRVICSNMSYEFPFKYHATLTKMCLCPSKICETITLLQSKSTSITFCIVIVVKQY